MFVRFGGWFAECRQNEKKRNQRILIPPHASLLALEEMPFHERCVENFRQIEPRLTLKRPLLYWSLNYSNFSPLHSIPSSRRWSESHRAQVASNAVNIVSDNHQSLTNLRVKSEFLTMSELRNRLVLTFLEQDMFCRWPERR